ncbi:MAG: carbon starvation protein A, partial [Thermodesulfobacteriota bacterium]
RPVIYTLIPMIFLVLMTIASMIYNFKVFMHKPLLLTLSAVILALSIWLLLEAYLAYKNQKSAK